MFIKKILVVSLLLVLGCITTITRAADDFNLNHFGQGKIYATLQGGWGKAFSLGIAGDGDGRHSEYSAVLPQLNIGLTDVLGENSWYRGNLDVVFEGEFLLAYEPQRGYTAGLGLLLRYNFLFSEQWVPYFEIGGGVGTLDFDLRDQADGLIFYPQAGLGMHYFLTDNFSADLGWRFHHMSNANTKMPNNSINASLLLLGFSWYFD